MPGMTFGSREQGSLLCRLDTATHVPKMGSSYIKLFMFICHDECGWRETLNYL